MGIFGKNGNKYKTKYYILDTIIAIGYRVNLKNTVKFRQWASKIVKEYIIKGFVLDDDKNKILKKLNMNIKNIELYRIENLYQILICYF